MSNFKTNTIMGDARERTKNLENITLMGNINNNLQTKFQTDISRFENNALRSTNNHSTLLKLTKGYYDLEPCCDLSKTKAFSLDDGMQSKIIVNQQIILANSSCNRQPLYQANSCNTDQPNILMTKRNFNYPIPITKNTCCSQDRTQPIPQISTENHTKYLPIMSKIKKYHYRTTDDTITYPNFNIVNENNMVGYFKNDIYKTTNSCSTSQCTSQSSTTSNNVGHKLKYTVQNTNANCSCADYDDYKIQTTMTPSSNTPSNLPSNIPSNSTYFSRKWSKCGC